ncbi:MAG: efflux RND transporter permease subunit [Gammaproteobacteria bacterium]|nr:efflux RND transporter permease subunit [Gammaproteobacteria bacterium]MDH4253653.1 efflux RND transporter permease subunit [Gammaproteobacteria bacterium]MDH5309769.1 efflux RND transporter permease subunit [Gammaproteobacteria bacterium]
MNGPGITQEKGLIAWFASNHVAANLLMVLILAFGIISSVTIRKQTTPDFELRNVQVRVPYLGAAPQEVEEGVIIKIEEAIQDVDGIVEINSDAREGLGTVTIEVATGADINEVLNEVKTQVDAISTFPALTEKPVIYKQEIPIHVVFVALHGNMDEYARKALAQQIRDELILLPSVNQVQYLGDRDYEISVEVSEQTLRRYGLTMSEVSEAIRASSVDLPGGAIKTEGGDILLRTEGQVYTGLEFGDIVLRTNPDGTRLTVGDIATIDDGFVETEGFGRFDGRRTAMMRVLAVGEQNELTTARDVKKFIEERSASLPPGINLDVWVDRSHYLQGRLDMMVRNMLQGALLVFIVLSLFLRLKFAMWVIIGIPIAFFGAMWLMPHGPWPVTVNVISLFGFILVLGILVDDAIIIGESVYTTIRADGHSLDNVVRGAKKVAVPATFGVLTTMAAFAPMLFVGGIPGPFFEAMSVVVILCLFFSLVESKLILPAHLAHSRIADIDESAIFRPFRDMSWRERPTRFFQRLNRYVQRGLHSFVANRYQPLLEKAVANRGLTVTIFAAVLVLTIGVMNSGLSRVVLFPEVPGDFIQVQLAMQNGSSPEARNAALEKLERAALDLNAEWVADHPDDDAPINHLGVFTQGDTGGLIFAEMPMTEDRALNGDDIEIMWRERVGEIPGVKELTFSGGDNIGGGAPLSFNLSGNNYNALEEAARDLERKLQEYQGVFDIRNSLSTGGEEISLRIKPEAEALGLNMVTLGRQVRQAFYGEEAQRIQRGKDELKVMVRYPRDERRSVADLENMRIRTPAGDEVPFPAVAEVRFGQAYSSIKRQNRSRVVTVSADLDPETVEPGEIIREISDEYMPELLARYPGVSFSLEGASQEEIELLRNLTVASVAALFLIYGLIAIPLRSYSQPLVIMSVIPFGLIGAVFGHILMGKAISMFSLFGLIALAGVVVNDSIIMIDFINRARQEGVSVIDAVIQSGTQRFRAIILTSLTTAAGLMPIMLEKSVQAQFVIPMAISLAFGIIFATIITLFLVPALYLLQLDLKAQAGRMWRFLLGRDAGDEGSVSATT